jgi:hypothetical protein
MSNLDSFNFLFCMGCLAVCVVDRELYGSGWCSSVQSLNGIFKFLLLFGAGGSGETEVINSVLAYYVKGFCKKIKYVFNKQMIVVIMAMMSGVAPTMSHCWRHC